MLRYFPAGLVVKIPGLPLQWALGRPWRTKIPHAVWCGILNKHTQKKPVSPDLEGAVRCFIVMIQRGCHQLMDILLTGWCWGKWESASSILSVQPVWDLFAGGQDTVNFSHLMEVSVSVKQLVYSLRGNEDPAPRLQYCLFWLFLVSASSPFPN